ncbi:MAG: tetratricopeptide repeat protein [Magnetococcales bacterium]|nr:tetratricopeptide repeat protein [Magnetococcales bacterium]
MTTDNSITEILNKALKFHQQGRLDNAEALYRRVLAIQSQNMDALHLLGMVHFARNDLDEAQRCISKALERNPQSVIILVNLGHVLCGAKRYEQALTYFQQAVLLDASFADAYFGMGRIHEAQERVEQAVKYYQATLERQKNHLKAHVNLGRLYLRLNQLMRAFSHLEQAKSLTPVNGRVDIDLTKAKKQLAILFWQQAGEHMKEERWQQTTDLLNKSIALAPDFAEARNDMGNLLQAMGRFEEALEHYRIALDNHPGFAIAHNNMGNALVQLNRSEASIEHYHQALEINPGFLVACDNLARALQKMGRVEEAAELFEKIGTEDRSNSAWAFKLANLLPPIMTSFVAIDQTRQQLHERLSRLENHITAPLLDPYQHVGTTLFYLAYHGRNDRAFHERMAKAYLKAAPDLGWQAPHTVAPVPVKGRRLKIGLISKYLFDHSIGKITRGYLEKLDRSRFELIALFIPPTIDDTTSLQIREQADHGVILVEDLVKAREQIAALQLDILFYQDIGMESFSYLLCFSRLAPVQCVTYGHPVTTGVPNMDYFVSSELYEPENGQEHYSEKLVLIPDAATLTYYQEPPRPKRLMGRDHYGFDEQDHLYLCHQTLYKIHPDFDTILADILTRDPKGKILFVDGVERNWSAMLKKRLAQTIRDGLSTRIHFLKPMAHDRFMGLISIADVVLDTPHFNGMTSALEVFSMGIPCVTLPGNLQRGRHVQGMYRRMGLVDLIAKTSEQYVDLSLRLTHDEPFRRKLRDQILARKHLLFHDQKIINCFEQFFSSSYQHAVNQGCPEKFQIKKLSQ